MKRGFLNSKKAKDRPFKCLDNNGVVNAVPPEKLSKDSEELQPPGDGPTTVSRPMKRSEPIIGSVIVEGIPANSRTSEPFAVVHFPSVRVTKFKEPSSTCILRPSTCRTIMDTPGFYAPPSPPVTLDPTNIVFTKSTPMGVGLFAKSSFKVRQIILTERPLLIFPNSMLFPRIHGLSSEENEKMSKFKYESVLQRALGAMPKADADAYMSLSNCLPDSPPLYGIARTNSFNSGIEELNIEEGKLIHGVIGKLASRINHSCIPNIHVGFDIPTFSLQLTALRDIKPGNQLFCSYIEERQSVKERRRQLATYGFVCQCNACVNATPQSDKLREEVDDRLQRIIDGEEEMFADPCFSVRSLGPLLELEKEIVKEELDSGPEFAVLLSIILKTYRKFKISAGEMVYFDKVRKYTGSRIERRDL